MLTLIVLYGKTIFARNAQQEVISTKIDSVLPLTPIVKAIVTISALHATVDLI